MKKYQTILLLFYLLMATVSCQNFDPTSSTAPYPPTTKAIEGLINEPYSFDEITMPEVWSSFQSFEEMMEACQIPEGVLSKLSTEALILTCLNHPLALSYTAYNDELKGVDVICKTSNVFQELLNRPDGMNQLVRYYDSFPEVKVWTPTLKNTNSEVSIASINLVELIIANNLSKVDDIVKREVLTDAINKWKIRKETDNNLFSWFSLAKTVYLAEKAIPTKSPTVSGGNVIGYVYLQTTFDQNVTGYSRQEMLPSEIAELDAYYIQHYPNATFDASSTWYYNCHSYAWNISDGGTTCWIQDDGNCHLSRYWTNDYYCSTNFPGLASKIYYYNSDHSAVKISENLYLSKWGCCPRMYHAPGYGPYSNMSQRHYYRPVSVLDVLDGNDLTAVGVTNYYSTDIQDNSRFTYSWTVERANGTPTGFNASPNGYMNTIVFNQTGLFNISCDVYYQGSYVGSQWLEVAVE